MVFKGLDKALKVIQAKVNEALLDEVAEVIKQTEVTRVVDDVYSRPTSELYQRRYFNGGLGDINNMHERLEGDGRLAVSNDTPFNPFLNGADVSDGMSANAGLGEGLDGLVNYGDGWNGIQYDWASPSATGYIEKTVEELKATKEHVQALKQGLKARGLDVK